jgi:hypothetical protein
MSITPPVAVPLLLLAAVIVFAILRPVEPVPDKILLTVTLPAAVYHSLQHYLECRLVAENQPLTVERWLADEVQRSVMP